MGQLSDSTIHITIYDSIENKTVNQLLMDRWLNVCSFFNEFENISRNSSFANCAQQDPCDTPCGWYAIYNLLNVDSEMETSAFVNKATVLELKAR
ncbi:hypothetical protein RCL1_007393 [Eukaryota sp. TZLM3-RCL]